eukprot:9432828-Pyramimonas_sp.AAC.1
MALARLLVEEDLHLPPRRTDLDQAHNILSILAKMGAQTAAMSSCVIRAAHPTQGPAVRQMSALAAPARAARTLMANKIHTSRPVLKMSTGQLFTVGRRDSMRCYAAAATE